MKPMPQSPSEAHAIQCELAAEVLRSLGRLRLRVTGWSMLPAILPGDILAVDHIASKDTREGDIVLFERERRIFAHRVIAKSQAQGNETILTRGDAMPQPDPPVPYGDVLGKVALIVRDGKRIAPRRRLRLPQRAVAAAVQRSEIAARVAMGVIGLRKALQSQASPVRASQAQNV